MLKVGEISKNVLGGIDDYLFLWQGAQQQFKYLSNELQPSKNSIENFKSNIEDRIAVFQSKGIKYIHCIFPGKPLVSWDKLPLGKSCKTLRNVWYMSACNGILTGHEAKQP